MRKRLPKRHHLDRRADAIVAAGDGPPDELLSTKQVAAWLGVSVQWLEIGRHKGYGPNYIKLSPRRIRYRRLDVSVWLESRRYACTSEYVEAGS
nr:hypothetical protein 6 [bacterium]